jgi:hypothetical protein
MQHFIAGPDMHLRPLLAGAPRQFAQSYAGP